MSLFDALIVVLLAAGLAANIYATRMAWPYRKRRELRYSLPMAWGGWSVAFLANLARWVGVLA